MNIETYDVEKYASLRSEKDEIWFLGASFTSFLLALYKWIGTADAFHTYWNLNQITIEYIKAGFLVFGFFILLLLGLYYRKVIYAICLQEADRDTIKIQIVNIETKFTETTSDIFPRAIS